jgi:hypothetical protein
VLSQATVIRFHARRAKDGLIGHKHHEYHFLDEVFNTLPFVIAKLLVLNAKADDRIRKFVR